MWKDAISDLSRWHILMSRLGAIYDIERIFKVLMDCYNEPHRAYHTMTHIRECLMQFDIVSAIAEYPDPLEASIWFHDAVYDPKSHQNEEKSAESASLSLTECGVSSEIAQRITNLILATRHDTMMIKWDERLIADIDLSILGNHPERFDEYESQIRMEYQYVPDELYRKGRSEVLRSFIEREMIYQTDIFRVQYETQARENIHRLLHRLNDNKVPRDDT